MKIAISAAETSGDLVASALIKSLLELNPECTIEGMAGDKMTAAGCQGLWHLNQVDVMGFSEVLKKLPSLLRLRKAMVAHFSEKAPAVFIGVDAPDFNFKIERQLKACGTKTVHFVSPSVWAWRSGRIKKIKESTDLMLCMFPFEVDFYRKHGQKALFVGHPLAETLQPRTNHQQGKKVLLMPGSREAEIRSLLPEMLGALKLMKKQDEEISFSLALANTNLQSWVEAQLVGLDVEVSIGDAHQKIKQTDLVIVASGTATLEIAMMGVPMVVVYKLSAISYQIAKRLLKTDYVSLPNVMLGKEIVPELLQDKANAVNISNSALQILAADNTQLVAELSSIHTQLNQGSAEKSAKAILEFIDA
ncbi:MAG: lipid-A-disaccharide synthase [Gammaproteobacteria bacterium]|nr:lipid-A-disaccharide synthase [Gammaproteobacteria bacterium]